MANMGGGTGSTPFRGLQVSLWTRPSLAGPRLPSFACSR